MISYRTCERCKHGVRNGFGAINAYTINGKRGYWHVRCARLELKR